MAGLSITQMKDTVDGIFPLKTFFISLALLIIALFTTITTFQLFIAAPVEDTAPTGKIMATLELDQKIEDQPIQTVVEEQNKTPDHTVDTGETAHPLTEADLPAAEETKVDEKISIEDSIAGLTEESTYGYLPIVRASDSLKSFDAYKAPFQLASGTKSVISLVMVDYGLSDTLAKNALEILPAATTFVTSSYSKNLQAKITAARTKSMEVWMGVPIQGTETDATINMGPDTILSGLKLKENITRLKSHLGKATGYAGVVFNVGTTFEEGSPDLKSIINEISNRGLGLAQLNPQDKVMNIASVQTDVPYINGDVWIDTTMTKSNITDALSKIEKTSQEKGYAIASFHPSILTASVIAEWQKSLASKSIQLAPLTYSIHISGNAPAKKEPAPVEKVEELEKKTDEHHKH